MATKKVTNKRKHHFESIKNVLKERGVVKGLSKPTFDNSGVLPSFEIGKSLKAKTPTVVKREKGSGGV